MKRSPKILMTKPIKMQDNGSFEEKLIEEVRRYKNKTTTRNVECSGCCTLVVVGSRLK